MDRCIINNVKIVTPGEIIEKGSLFIDNGIISSINASPVYPENTSIKIIDGQGRWLLPGLIDLHNDSIEKEVEPRPHVLIPMEIALFSLESRLVNHGITSIYHSLSILEGESAVRTEDGVISNINEIHRLKKYGIIRHRVHARYEITEMKFCPILTGLMDRKLIDLISFQDHTPGQGQNNDLEGYRKIMRRKLSVEAYQKLMEREKRQIVAKASGRVDKFIDILAEKAQKNGLSMASHDDDSRETIIKMKSKGVTISEFPVNLEAAKAASEENLYVMVGAPNIIRGSSASGNLRAIDAIRHRAAHIICSDYISPTMLHALFHLHYTYGIDLVEVVKMATLNPAKAVGIGDTLGSIEKGKLADLILVKEIDRIPFVDHVFVNGVMVMRQKRGEEYDAGRSPLPYQDFG